MLQSGSKLPSVEATKKRSEEMEEGCYEQRRLAEASE
jgi:hypothetical protein